MGQPKSKTSSIYEKIERYPIELIDFLYIDNQRLDSYISQIDTGVIRNISKTNGLNRGNSVTADMGINAGVRASYSYKSDYSLSEIAAESNDTLVVTPVAIFRELHM